MLKNYIVTARGALDYAVSAIIGRCMSPSLTFRALHNLGSTVDIRIYSREDIANHAGNQRPELNRPNFGIQDWDW